MYIETQKRAVYSHADSSLSLAAWSRCFRSDVATLQWDKMYDKTTTTKQNKKTNQQNNQASKQTNPQPNKTPRNQTWKFLSVKEQGHNYFSLRSPEFWLVSISFLGLWGFQVPVDQQIN